MFHACAARFDVTENLENFLLLGELNKALEPVKIWEIHQFNADKIFMVDSHQNN